MRGTSSHPSAEWIYEQVRKEIPGVGLATVYRNLRLMKDAGEICELHTADSATHFDGDTSVHYHFLCDRCGRIMDLDEPVDANVESRVEQKTGLKVTRHHLALYGLCMECQEDQPGMNEGRSRQ